MQKWEYCLEFLPMIFNEKEDKLNYLGNEGWELCCPVKSDDPLDGKFYIFKRQKCSSDKLNEGLTIHPIHPGENCYCNDCYSSRVVSGKE